jgi:hypothetical protein
VNVAAASIPGQKLASDCDISQRAATAPRARMAGKADTGGVQTRAWMIQIMHVRLKQVLLIKFPRIMMDCLLLTTHSIRSALTFQSR